MNIMKLKKFIAVCLCFTVLAASAVASASCSLFGAMGAIPASTLMKARELARNSNIAIDTQYSSPAFGGWISRNEGTALGSGVVFYETDDTYYALTNHHVITNVLNGKVCTTKYTVTDIHGVEYTGRVLKQDASQDIAIVSFKKVENSVLRVIDYRARLGQNMIPNEFVLAVGNPSGVKNIVTYGQMISYAEITADSGKHTALYHNALINPGNSGGALVDLDGNLLGLNTWGSQDSDEENFAIPLSIIYAFVTEFYEEYDLTPPAYNKPTVPDAPEQNPEQNPEQQEEN